MVNGVTPVSKPWSWTHLIFLLRTWHYIKVSDLIIHCIQKDVTPSLQDVSSKLEL